MKALIAGGGIGGITAALCLLEAGIDVELYERGAALGEIGAGIQISPNGVKVLDRLGLKPALDRVAFRPEALEMRVGMSGVRLFSIPMRDEAVRRYGAPYYHVHRADLMDVLSEALRARAPHAVHVTKDVAAFAQSDKHVELAFADGTRAEGDVLIGADGIHSRVRTQMLGPDPARFTGNVAWRLVVPATSLPKDLVPPTACVWVGPGRHAVTYYLRRGELVNFVGVVEREGWQKENWTERGDPAELAADYAGWSKPIASIVAQASECYRWALFDREGWQKESWTERGDPAELAADYAGWSKPIASIVAQASECYRWALFDREPLATWHDGRVTLLGDACHPMLPFLGQGAVMAIEDAWVLSRKLKASSDIPHALGAYERARKPRTSRVQKGARAQMGLYHKRSLTGQLATYGPMWLAARMTPSVVHARQDWLYSHDVVTDD